MAYEGTGDTINWVFSFWTMLDEDERRHEEGKLEFRDAEDDAVLVGRDEGR